MSVDLADVLQGHFQIALNKERCPLLQKRLSWGMRILYMSGVWSYIVGFTSTPMFVIIPVVRIDNNIYHLLSTRSTLNQFSRPMLKQPA